uniref:Uncharacterized protein n=1 Tax=Tetraselmis sp. GSL018 TaxID=582737 RepID=A0A061SHX4_9CHLO
MEGPRQPLTAMEEGESGKGSPFPLLRAQAIQAGRAGYRKRDGVCHPLQNP